MAEEEIAMTPLRCSVGSVIKFERLQLFEVSDQSVQHIAGGPYKGIIIRKGSNELPDQNPSDSSRAFVAHLTDPKTKELIREKRNLKFWFRNVENDEEAADNFLEQLLDPLNFPKNYTNFIVRLLNLLKLNPPVKKLELEMRPPTADDDIIEADIIRKKVTRITRTTKQVVTSSNTSGQDDHLPEQEGHLGTAGLIGAGIALAANADQKGSSKDYTKRHLPTQEANVDEAGRSNVMGGSYQGEHFSTSPDAQGINRDYTARNVPTQEANLEEEQIERVTLSTQISQTGGYGSRGYEVQMRQKDNLLENNEPDPENVQGVDHIEKSIIMRSVSQSGADGSPNYMAKLHSDKSSLENPEPAMKRTASQENLLATQDGIIVPAQVVETASFTATTAKQAPMGPSISKRGHMIIWIAKKQKLLNALEDAYPNILQTENLVRLARFKPDQKNQVLALLQDLSKRGLIQEVENGRFMRIQAKQTEQPKVPANARYSQIIQAKKKKHDIQIIKHIPRLSDDEQPTIAIVTLLYCEKLAVDAMMDTKTTYVRYKTEGEAQVYTVGEIGKQRVVSTKLSRIGSGEGAKVSAGNTITRLLGTFTKIDHVILVGVGGAVPNYKNDSKHVRLGDIVVSAPEYNCGPIYVHCTGAFEEQGGLSFDSRSWNASEDTLEKHIIDFQNNTTQDVNYSATWLQHLDEALEELENQETRFIRPPPESDRLIQEVDGEEVEYQHPTPVSGSIRDNNPNAPLVHYGVIATGKTLMKDESARQEFALFNEVKATDSGFQAVMESIEGNRSESVAIIRGISDYKDGTKKKEWQPYASLLAAAYMKALILALPVPEEEDDD